MVPDQQLCFWGTCNFGILLNNPDLGDKCCIWGDIQILGVLSPHLYISQNLMFINV